MKNKNHYTDNIDLSNVIHTFGINNVGSDYVVGDIHGNYPALDKALNDIGFNFKTDRLFCTGDLVDRGTNSKSAIHYLNHDWFYSAQGNHDDHIVRYRTANNEIWYSHGGSWHGELTEYEKEVWRARFLKLPIIIEVITKNGLVGIVHADCPTDDWLELRNLFDVTKSNMKEVKLRINKCKYNRDRFNNMTERYIDNVSAVYFGHNGVNEMIKRSNSYYIDSYQVSGKFTIIKIN